MAEGFLVNLIFGFAVNLIMNALFKQDTANGNTHTYSDQLQTTISNTLPIPLVYGTVKQAGNMIYQVLNSNKTVCSKLVCFGLGPIQDISDIRVNDLVVGSSTTNYSTAVFIWNNEYSDSVVSVSGNTLYCSNKAGSFSVTVSDKTYDLLVTRIQEHGAGWQATNQGLSDYYSLNDMASTNCYNKPSALKVCSSDSVYSASGYRKYLGTGTQKIDSLAPGDTQEAKAKAVGGLRWDAYVAIWATASDQISGDFNTTALIHGRIVRIYTSTSSYYEAWSDNPAWCIMDFLTCVNGVGLGYDQLDIQAFIDAAAYCDELITNLDGTQQKRFTLNMVVGDSKTRLDWLADMMRTCQAFPTYQNGKYGIIVEQPEDVSQSFDSKSMNDLEVWWSPMDEIVDVLRVKYVDPSYDWAKIMAFSEADEYLRDFPFTYDVEILGITNFSQASRISWFYQNQSSTCTTWCKFKTDRRAIARSIGDVISVSDYVVEWENKKFRVMKMTEAEEDKIEVTCREYNPAIYTDSFGSVKPVVNTTKLANPFDKPPTPSFGTISQSYYILPNKRGTISEISAEIIPPSGYSAYKQFRYWYSDDAGTTWKFGGITSEPSFTISGMEIGKTYYIKCCMENFYGVFSDYFYSGEIYFVGNNAVPSTITNFTVTETVGGFNLTWDANTEPDLDYYIIYLDNFDTVVANVVGTSYFFPATTGNYVFFIRAIDTAGNKSELTSCVGSISAPSQVQGFNAYQSGNDIMFVWEQNSGENVSYEIRRGDSWDVGLVVARAMGNFAKLQFASVGSHKFWIKAKSIHGVYCESATWSILDVVAAIDRNVIYSVSDIPKWGGVKQNVEVIGSGLQLTQGMVHGEYIHDITLPYSCTSRNWIDTTIQAVVSGGVTWGDADFRWDSTKSNSPWLSSTGRTSDLSVAHQIAIKGDLPTSCVESIYLAETTAGEKSFVASESSNITYDNARFRKGAVIKDTSFLKYTNISIPAVFSLTQTIKITSKLLEDHAYLTLKSDNAWMLLEYIYSKDKFYLRSSDGKDIGLYVEKDNIDFITLAISQGETTRRLLGYSTSSGKKFSQSISAASLGVFTSMALYANI